MNKVCACEAFVKTRVLAYSVCMRANCLRTFFRVEPPEDWRGEPEIHPAPIVSWVELEDDERWRGYYFVLAFDRAGALRTFEARRLDDGAIEVDDFKQLPLSSLVQAARRSAVERLQQWDDGYEDDEGFAYLRLAVPEARDWIEATADPPSDRDRQLARMCKRYLDLKGDPEWRENLSKEFRYKVGGIPTMIARARQHGYLSPAPGRGQHGGELTPKSLRLLVPAEKREMLERLIGQLREAEIAADHPELDPAEVSELRALLTNSDLSEVDRTTIEMVLWGVGQARIGRAEATDLRRKLAELVAGDGSLERKPNTHA